MLESLALHYSWYDFYDVLEKSLYSLLRIWSHLLKKSLMKNFIFCTVKAGATAQIFVLDFVQKRFYSSSVVLEHILGTFSFL